MITDLSSINNPQWQEKSACLNEDPGIFFNKGDGNLAKARKICATCPVIKECLDWILKLEKGGPQERSGVYAGLTANQRREIALCVLGDCTNKRKSEYIRYCSLAHKQIAERLNREAYKKKLRKENAGRWTPDDSDYYMKGRVING